MKLLCLKALGLTHCDGVAVSLKNCQRLFKIAFLDKYVVGIESRNHKNPNLLIGQDR